MSELSEEEIIDNAEKLTYEVIVEDDLHNWDDMSPNEIATIMKGLLDLYQKEKQKNECLRDNLNHSIRSSAIKERLGIEENISEEQMLDYIDILVSENARLEDIEDKKVQIEYQNVFNKGVKSVENKIKEKIEDYKEKSKHPLVNAQSRREYTFGIKSLQELL